MPGMGEPGGLPSMGSHGVGHNWSDLAATAAGTSNNTILLLGDGPQHLTSKDNWKKILKTNKKQQQK